ncbi:MAG: pseudouridine synthase [Gammaproteobacteria bacterium]|nr:pseudouridine synthase [Gammaproteobacteria bacterium]
MTEKDPAIPGSKVEPIRLSKLMSQKGICSRREADRYIEGGMVYVDGERVSTLGIKVLPSAKIRLNQKAQDTQAALTTVLLNKPMDYVSGLPEDGYTSAVMLIDKLNRQHPGDTVPNRKGLAPAGRLDIDSMGLIVFTQDGRIAKQLIGPENRIEKEYLVWATGEITQEKLALLRHGLSLDNQLLRPAGIDHITGSQMRFTLIEGRKRQIRRMCELVDLQVTRLIRVRIGNVKLGKLESGKWRLLRDNERF